MNSTTCQSNNLLVEEIPKPALWRRVVSVLRSLIALPKSNELPYRHDPNRYMDGDAFYRHWHDSRPGRRHDY